MLTCLRSPRAPLARPARRSPAVVLAYLIKAQRWRLAHCHAWLKERRPEVNLQPAAAQQLEAYELAVLGDEARTPPPPLPPRNPLPTNDSPFGVGPQHVGGPFSLPGGDASYAPQTAPPAAGYGAFGGPHGGWTGQA